MTIPKMPRACPECGSGLRNPKACACGWTAAPTSTGSGGKSSDPDWWRCADTLLGQRCGLAGTMSHSTQGGGPWYCAQHFRKEAPGKVDRTPGNVHAMREIARKYRQPDADEIAEREAIQGEANRIDYAR